MDPVGEYKALRTHCPCCLLSFTPAMAQLTQPGLREMARQDHPDLLLWMLQSEAHHMGSAPAESAWGCGDSSPSCSRLPHYRGSEGGRVIASVADTDACAQHSCHPPGRQRCERCVPIVFFPIFKIIFISNKIQEPRKYRALRITLPILKAAPVPNREVTTLGLQCQKPCILVLKNTLLSG